MNTSQKSSQAQFVRLLVHDRPLHPELFDLQARRVDRHGEFETEKWLTAGGHIVRFQVEDHVLTETVIEQGNHLPDNGLIHALPCLGEKEYAYQMEGLNYVTTVQTEMLTDNLYTATLREMRDFAEETGSLSHEYPDQAEVECLSVLDSQKYRHEFHIQSYHLLGNTGVVLRTQSIFEVA